MSIIKNGDVAESEKRSYIRYPIAEVVSTKDFEKL